MDWLDTPPTADRAPPVAPGSPSRPAARAPRSQLGRSPPRSTPGSVGMASRGAAALGSNSRVSAALSLTRPR